MIQKQDLHFDPNKGLMYKNHSICNFNIEVIYRVVDINNTVDLQNNTVGYIVNVTISPDGITHNDIFIKNYKKCDWSNTVHGCIDGFMSNTDKKYLNTYIQYKLMNCQSAYYVKSIGYHPSIGYVLGKNNVITFMQPNKKCVFSDNIPEYNTNLSVGLKHCISYAQRLLKWNDIMIVPLSWWFLSIIKPILYLENCKLSGILGIIGSSGSLKTSIARIFTTAEEKFINLNKTTCANILSTFRHSIILIDDYKNNAQKHVRDRFKTVNEYLIRSQDTYDAPLIITTGEILDGDYSTQDRVLQLYLEKKKSDYSIDELQELKWLQDNSQYMEVFRLHLIKLIYSNEKNFTFVKNYIRDNKNCLISNIQYRIDELCSYCILSFKILNKILDEKLQDLISVFNDIKNQQILHMKIISNDYSYILSSLYINGKLNIDIEPNKNSTIFLYNGYLCIEPDTLLNLMEEQLKTKVNYKTLINQLKKDNLIVYDKSGANTKKINHQNKYIGRFIYFDLRNFREYYDQNK